MKGHLLSAKCTIFRYQCVTCYVLGLVVVGVVVASRVVVVSVVVGSVVVSADVVRRPVVVPSVVPVITAFNTESSLSSRRWFS